MTKSVLLLNDALDAASVSAVQTACSQIGAEVSEAKSTDTLTDHEAFDLCIAGLKRGERQVSDQICELLSSQENVAPLLMLCDEPLVRNRVSLQDARVNLLANPVNEGLLADSIHSLIDGLEWTESEGPSPSAQAAMVEAWGHHYWTASLSKRTDDANLILDKRTDGILACLCDNSLVSSCGSLLAPIETLFLDHESGVDQAIQSVSGVGTLASLNTQTARWRFDVAAASANVFLCSPQRSPATFEIRDNREMWAAPGDVVIIVRDGKAICTDETFELARRAGGQVLARTIRESHEQLGENFACLLLEVVG